MASEQKVNSKAGKFPFPTNGKVRLTRARGTRRQCRRGSRDPSSIGRAKFLRTGSIAAASPAKPELGGALLFLRFAVRVDQIARFVLRRVDDHLGREVAKLLDAVALDVLELNQQHAIFRPFPLVAELHVADHAPERSLAHVIRQHIVLSPLGSLY